MAAVDPVDAVQKGVFDLLSGDAALALLVNGVVDGPTTLDPDYVSIGEALSTPAGLVDREGRSVSVTLHTWTRGEGFKKANDIGARLVALLWHRHADLDPLVVGHDVWRVVHEFHQNLVDPEPGLRHRIDRFRVWTCQS